jgi:hypothetical protein
MKMWYFWEEYKHLVVKPLRRTDIFSIFGAMDTSTDLLLRLQRVVC